MAIKIVLSTISVFFIAIRADECPGALGSDWITGLHRCYRYISTPMEWKAAQKHCSTLGFAGSLAFLNNREASNNARSAVVNAVSSTHAVPEWIWIGLTDEGHENIWKSPDGETAEELGFRSGQPDNYGGNEHYVHINGETWDWNDIPDNNEYPFICQVEPRVKNEVHCPTHWHQRGNLCYKYIDSHMNWYDAQERCSILAREGSLAYVGSEQDNANVFQSTGTDGDFWIGLTDLCHEGRWSSPYGKVTQYTNWQPDEPNDSTGEDCVHITKTDSKWNDLDCGDNKRPFVCQMSAKFHARRCPAADGWVQRGDNCYLYVYIRESVTWNEALAKCRQQGQGGTLPFISSEAENNEVYEAAAMSAGGECVDNFRNFWIGITDHEVEGQWTGPDGVGRVTSYSAWAPGEPNDGDFFTSEEYVEMQKGTRKWNDENGSEDAYVCRFPAKPECICPDCPIPEPCPPCPDCPEILCPLLEPCPECPQCPLPEPCPDPVCPPMWTAYDGGCYLYNGKKVPWQAANNQCADLGASLVDYIVPDDDEHRFLCDYIAMTTGSVNVQGKVAWIGLNDIEEEGNFRWHDGGVFEGEIDQRKKKKKRDCVSMNLTGRLIHDMCTKKRAFVCKKPQAIVSRYPSIIFK